MSKASSSRLLGSRLWPQHTAPPGTGFLRQLHLQRPSQQPQSISIHRNLPTWWHGRHNQVVPVLRFSSPYSTKFTVRSTGVLEASYNAPALRYHHGGPVPAFTKLLREQQYSYSSQGKTAQERPITRRSSESLESKRPQSSQQQRQASEPQSSEDNVESIATSVSKYLHLPKLPHRPAKEELLAAANGFWERLKVRFKWMSIRSMRPWNADEWGAFVSWFMLGHIVWILVGTTTFFSLLIFSINTVFAQVVFESAIVPKWKNGVIAFRNVFVSRRPGQVKSSVSKGSSDAAAVAAAGRQAHFVEYSDPADDGNYTQFDVTIANVNVTLSFLNWWNGKGLLKDVEVNGVRGVVDRTSVHWPMEEVDPLSYRHEHQPGDFEIESFKLEDLLLIIHQPGGFRPFSVSIYSCELPRLRKQWLFYDFLSANHMSGSFDGSLFTIHPRQVHGIVSRQNQEAMTRLGEQDAWEKFSRLRIDGLKIDHLNRGVEGPFGWIYEGNVDIVADLMLPAETDEGITKVMADFYDQLEEAVIVNKQRLLQNSADNSPVLLQSGHLSEAGHVETAGTNEAGGPGEEDRRYLIMDMRIHMNDVKAAVPLFTRDISYINQALVRPIVAYINAKKTYIPISCRIVKRLSDFDGSWTVFDCGLMNDASVETYDAFAKDVENQQSRVRRFKKVGFWTLSLAVHALFMGMAGNVV
ncbi:mitochondrial distribution and morphology protein [Metarhizium album ARSEF 1941]|uniref:Mitochondrial distribution and morphology protein n=1 Tax=Metarhizium album (strain ARSEF 1941) TaxID=1081103 RepID=A0A0B2X0E9_METAS|nr:mitochondrial distribution and morphology protein [Metarhizium album ARSEF 1941]KHN98570.1 mitochondrial distribution and morphology protein [Metarhizium album ARSEF 1941]